MTSDHGNGRPREASGSHPDLRPAFMNLAPAAVRTKGTVLFRQGETPRGIFLLLEGRARLFLADDRGRNITFRRVGPGYALGLPGTILGQRYLFSAELVEDSKVVFVPRDQVLEFLHTRSDLCLDVVKLLGMELAEMPVTSIHHASRRKRSQGH